MYFYMCEPRETQATVFHEWDAFVARARSRAGAVVGGTEQDWLAALGRCQLRGAPGCH